MKKLIELDAAVSALDGLPMDYGRWDVDDVLHALASVPTVDAVQVVRCKDCKMFYMKKDIFWKVPWCKTWHRGTIETMFCGWGKRKDGEQYG